MPAAPAMRMNMTAEATATPGLYRLLAWLSPSFPTGAFSYSHGLEAAAAAGAVRDRASLERWVAAIVVHGSGRIDAAILCDAHRAADAGDRTALDAANRRGLAFRATAELALESTQQGAAFLAAYEAAWATPPLPTGEGEAHRENGGAVRADGKALPLQGGGTDSDIAGVCHAAAFGAASARVGIALEDALLGYLQAFAGNLVAAGLRLGIVGQTDGQRILAALEPAIAAAQKAALRRDPADFGSAACAADLASMAHETQYSRLFRS